MSDDPWWTPMGADGETFAEAFATAYIYDTGCNPITTVSASHPNGRPGIVIGELTGDDDPPITAGRAMCLPCVGVPPQIREPIISLHVIPVASTPSRRGMAPNTR